MREMQREIEGRRCHIYSTDPRAPYIYWGVQDAGELQDMVKLLDGPENRRDYNLIAYEPRDWNGDFSPWSAPGVYGNADFAGNGMKTCKWLTQACIPAVEAGTGTEKRERFLAGYSLAGLFSLWAFYETGLFSGAVSCSGSLWYPGWLAYAKKARAPINSFVYLSLGTKEEKTKNQAMAAVGDATRQMAALLEEDRHITHSVLEWNPGGHFQKPLERTAKGIRWALQWG